MIVTHPITPLLALPGLLVAAFIADKNQVQRVRHAVEFAGSFCIGYIAWTLYQADWILTPAVRTILNAFQEEKRIPIVDSPIIPQVEAYVQLHRVFLIAMLVLLLLSYLYIWRSRIWSFITFWGLSFLPGFILLFSYRDFFDRILLFALIPCAIAFAEAGSRFFQRLPKLRIPAIASLTLLVLLAASVAYFGISAIDRVTPDEVAALEYLASVQRPIVVYADGFNIPLAGNLRFIPAPRGVLRLQDLDRAEAVVLSQQLQNAVQFSGSSEISWEDFMAYLEIHFQEVYVNGETRVFLRRPGFSD
jgi:hypothetical protein